MTSLWTGFMVSVMVLSTVEGGNVALNKVTSQSSNQGSFGSHKAVDGKTEQIFLRGHTCTHTTNIESTSSTQWWLVDLGEMYYIDFIIIWNRADCCANRLSDFSVYVGTMDEDGAVDYSLCFFHGGYFPNTTNITCDQPQIGRFVKIELPNRILTLCEMEVHGTLVPPTSSSSLSEIDQSPSHYTEIASTSPYTDATTTDIEQDLSQTNLMLQSTSDMQILQDYTLHTTPVELVFSETIFSGPSSEMETAYIELPVTSSDSNTIPSDTDTYFIQGHTSVIPSTFDASALQTYTDMSHPPSELETSHTEIAIALTDTPTDMSLSETPVSDVSQGFTSSIAPSLESVAPAGDVERFTYVRCGCFCLKTESPAEQAAELKESLQMDTGNLSSSIRKKTSAKNKEASATYLVGLGIAMITVISVAILLPDVITVMSYLWTHTTAAEQKFVS